MSKIKKITSHCQDALDCGVDERLVHDYLEFVARNQDDEIQKRLQKNLIKEYVSLERKVEGLLKNTLPPFVADEIRCFGHFTPRLFNCSILFADIVGFTNLAEILTAEELVSLLDMLFKGMDDILETFHGTKIKTIGDAYMAVFGAPQTFSDHAKAAVRTGLAFLDFVSLLNKQEGLNIAIRIGIHTGEVMAGVVGKHRMQFDVFGDSVNIASRFETAGEAGKVNVSHEVYLQTRNIFLFEERGDIPLKNKASMKAYFVVKEL